MDNHHKLLSDEDCKKIMENKLEKNNVKVLSYTVKPFSDKVEGLMGQHYRVEIEYEDVGVKSERFFMKILNGSLKTIFDLCMSVSAYEKEEFIYTTYLEELKKFKIDLDCLPRCYLCRPYIIVLEDLSEKGYVAAGTVDLDNDSCKAALETLAKFHASTILYESYKSKDHGKPFRLTDFYQSTLRNVIICKDNNLGRQWFLKSLEGVYKLIKMIPESHITNDAFEKRMREYVGRLHEIQESFSNQLCTVLHGDVWHNNFLFKYNNDRPYRSVLLDFQVIRYEPPILDVLHFIFANTRKHFRDKHMSNLISYYYNFIKQHLIKNNYDDIPTESKLLLLTKDVKVFVKLTCLCDRTVTLMSSDTPSSTFENDESLRKYLFEERTEYLVKSYKADKDFHEIIEEDILELRDLLFSEC